MSARRTRPGATLSRRRFVSLLATGSAALAAAPALAAKAAPAERTQPAAPAPSASRVKPPEAAALQKEFERQRAGTLETLATVREFALPPGGDLPVVFRPLRPARKGR